MKRLILLLALLLVGCNNTAQPPQITQESVAYWHDAAHGVSCWLYGRGASGYTAAISCLPDSELRP